MSDVAPIKVLILPYKFGAGDHMVKLLDFNLNQVIERGVSMRTPSMKRLICKNKKSVENYN